jgi:Na+:H+ antiporter, NhaA family
MTESPDAPEDQREELRPSWAESPRAIPRRLVRPLQEFLHTEASGAILLLAAALVALLWANILPGSYDLVWHTEVALELGPWTLREDLQHLINDGLMAIFFFVVGLEIKRELVTGELRQPRNAALPAFAALGGMVGPALAYLALNAGGEGSHGWGIPMATDIAFALGVLALVARGLPSTLKLFVLSLAIVDDIGAIAVIALFYSEGISSAALGVAATLLAVIVVLQRIHVRWMVVYVVLGVAVWLAVFLSGVHATIAGVALGLLTPSRPFQRPGTVSDVARRVADETADDQEQADYNAAEWLTLARVSREAISPLARLEHLLHPWTSFLIIPLFALANAGVDLGGGAIGTALASPITLGIVVGLVAGKLVGITAFSWIAVRLGAARLPTGVTWPLIVGAATLAGIGFTVSLFIAQLAFTDEELLAAAKVGILAASLVAGILGAGILRAMGRRRSSPQDRPGGAED